MNKQELMQEINKLPAKDRTLLKLVFVDNIPKVTLLWIYRVRYKTLQRRLIKILHNLHIGK